MKKLILLPISMFFIIGCSNTAQNVKPMSMKSITLLDKYGINESSLMKLGKNSYIFVIPAANGAAIYKLDKNYNLIWKKVTPILLNPVKSIVKNGKIYILGYDEAKNRVALVIYDTKGKLEKISYYGKKFDTAKDFIVEKEPIIAVTQYSKNNNSNIIIYMSDKQLTLNTPNRDNASFILPYKKGLLIVGTTQNMNQDVLIAYKKFNGKTVWAKTLDLGMDDSPLNVEIKKGIIILKVKSTDHMGAETYSTFEIDGHGNIKSIKKNIEFKQLPLKYRT